MSIHSPIFLKPDTVVNIDGKEFTAAELKEHVIDSVLYRKCDDCTFKCWREKEC